MRLMHVDLYSCTRSALPWVWFSMGGVPLYVRGKSVGIVGQEPAK